MFHFDYLDKSRAEALLPELFRILYHNMNEIAPTEGTYEEDLKIWGGYLLEALQEEPRQIVLMKVGEAFAGYFQYHVNRENGSLMMEEIQIPKEFQGTGVFSALYRWLLPQLPEDLQRVQAYANKQNSKSQAILEHLGLKQVGENKSGKSFYYEGTYENLRKRYL